MESLITWDQEVFLALNGLGHPYLDQAMLFLSAKLVWIPLYVFLIYLLYRHYGRKFWIPLVLVIVAVALSDQVTSGFMKPFFERFRPCKDPLLMDQVINVGKCGSKYGFASSHAANTFAVAVFFFALLRNKWLWLLVAWAALVSYSRIYLGVHFPGDIIVGGLIGTLFGWLLVLAARKLLGANT